MSRQDEKEILLRGVQLWNKWRSTNHHEQLAVIPDLRGVHLDGLNLRGADLRSVDLNSSILSGADLSGADLYGADLTNATLRRAQLHNALMGENMLVDVDLSGAKGLESVIHSAPSEISINTFYRSGAGIPEEFLLGCGVPESFIVQIPSLISALKPLQLNSCFISYSTKDGAFAQRLHARMKQAALRVWFAPENFRGGKKLLAQIDLAIHIQDRLLLVLSEHSMKSKWVELEIRRARNIERKEGRRKLFPIRLVSFEKLLEWECVDSKTGEDLAEEVRSYFIPDFSSWKNADDFERQFEELYEAFKGERLRINVSCMERFSDSRLIMSSSASSGLYSFL